MVIASLLRSMTTLALSYTLARFPVLGLVLLLLIRLWIQLESYCIKVCMQLLHPLGCCAM